MIGVTVDVSGLFDVTGSGVYLSTGLITILFVLLLVLLVWKRI